MIFSLDILHVSLTANVHQLQPSTVETALKLWDAFTYPCFFLLTCIVMWMSYFFFFSIPGGAWLKHWTFILETGVYILCRLLFNIYFNLYFLNIYFLLFRHDIFRVWPRRFGVCVLCGIISFSVLFFILFLVVLLTVFSFVWFLGAIIFSYYF